MLDRKVEYFLAGYNRNLLVAGLRRLCDIMGSCFTGAFILSMAALSLPNFFRLLVVANIDETRYSYAVRKSCYLSSTKAAFDLN